MQKNEDNISTEHETYFDASENQNVIEPSILQEETHQEEHRAEIDFSVMDKQTLLNQLQEAAKTDDIQGVASKVRMIREAFLSIVKTESEIKLAKYIEEGGKKEDFEMPKDVIDEKFKTIFTQFNKQLKELKVQKEKQLIENTAIKKSIIEELKALMKSEESNSKKYTQFQTLQTKWRSVGKVAPADANHLWQNYQLYASQFFDVMKISKELRELDMKKNLELKTELCERAEMLTHEHSLKKALEELHSLQDKWKEIGFITKEISEPVWARFKSAADKVYERYKENISKIKAKQEENLNSKKDLCTQLESALADSYTSFNQWKEATEKVNTIWEKWQKIGYVPKADNNLTWNLFKQLRQKFYDSKDVYFNTLKEEQNKNLSLKTSLCEKAESLQTNTDWNTTTEAYKKMQAEWKRIGAVPRKVSDKIWNRFKKACDVYFENKSKHFAEKDAVLLLNHKQKLEVIEKINNLKINDDNRVNLESLKNLQTEFNSVGEVPSKMFEGLFTAYRKAIDEYFIKIKNKKGDNDKLFHQMKYEQMQQSEQGKREMSKERNNIQDKIKHLQSEINQLENNLSFFSKSGKASAITTEYQTKIDTGKEEIKKLKDHLKLIPALKF